MANDVADWTSSVVVQSGTVTISGTAVVQISGTPNVNVANTPAVTINSGSVTATISGTPNVNIASQTGNLNVVFPVAQSVTFPAAQSVNIANTPAVTISSGTVTIANASIGVINALGTKITSSRPPKELGLLFTDSKSVSQNFVLDSDVQALVIQLQFPLNTYQHLKVEWLPSGPNAAAWLPLELFEFGQQVYVVPILPTTRDSGDILLNTIKVTLQASAGNVCNAVVTELFESAPEWLTLFPQPQLEPNQFPLFSLPSLVNGVAQWLIAPLANVQITIFSINLFWANADTTRPLYVGHNPTLPGAGLTPNPIFAQLTPGPPAWDLKGAQLPRGSGLYIEQINGATLGAAVTVIYSLS